MKGTRPARATLSSGRTAFDGAAAALLRNSLVAYVAAGLLGRAWALLNADVVQLLKR
jgi:hypothetical protein